jgi:hypothetical protein
MNVTFTVHGFRSSFKDWSVELTEYPNEMSELQLAHSVGTKVQQSYLRSLNLDKRRDMMTQWANYICS